jgi:hypothetical protein
MEKELETMINVTVVKDLCQKKRKKNQIDNKTKTDSQLTSTTS